MTKGTGSGLRIDVTMGEQTRIVLQMSTGMKLACGIVIVFSLLFAIAGIEVLMESPDDFVILLVGIAFFGGGAILIARLMQRNAGYIDIRADGVLLDTYITIGFIPWSNLAGVGSVGVLGAKYLAISLTDIATYVASRGELSTSTRARDLSLTQGFLRLMLMVAPQKVLDILLALFGYTKFPSSPSEADILRWNKENFGHHLLIQAFWLPDVERIVADISSRRLLHQELSEEEMTAQRVSEGYKKCPMCAEYVRAEAKICRYCRYTFERE